MLLGHFSEFSCHAGWRTQELKTLPLARPRVFLIIAWWYSGLLCFFAAHLIGGSGSPIFWAYWLSDFKVLTWSRLKSIQVWIYPPMGWMFLIRYCTLKVVKRCTQIWAYLWATHKNSYSKWRCPQIWGYLCEWLIVTCKNLCSSHFFRNWLFLKVNAILRCHTVSKS